MANLIRQQRLVDTNKRALVKTTIVNEGGFVQEANVVILDVSTLAYAKNANGMIMASNTHPKGLYRVRVKRVFGHGKCDGVVKLQWQGAANAEFLTIGNGHFDFDFDSMGDGAVMSNPEASSNGDILMSTTGFGANNGVTIFIDVRKDSEDYDAGQTADPTAFNR
jgi:hypothetical protein